MKRNKILILIILLLLILTPNLVTFSKYILEKTGTFNVNLKGVKFDDTNLVLSDNIDYSDTTTSLINPERGFYVPYEFSLTGLYTNAAKDEMLNMANNVKNDLKTNNYTLSRTIIYLNNHKNSDIPVEWISALDELCGTFRSDGYKLIVRFAYDKVADADPNDFHQILKHMDQLNSFFSKNSDVIFAVELGFIGPDGESHGSQYATKEYRNQIMKKALQVIPSPIKILVRKPSYYKDYFGDGYFDHRLGYKDNDAGRVGIFNNSFLTNVTDLETYTSSDREEELKWMSYLTKYNLFGGSSSFVSGENNYFDNISSIYNMTKTHTNYLNGVYDSNALSIWKNNTVTSDLNTTYTGLSTFKYISDKLGYRFLVNEVKVPNYAVNQGGYLNFSFSIDNVGFGNLVKYRNVDVILEKDGKYYQTTTEIDPRYWFAGEQTNEEVVIKLPGNISAGKWNIYIGLPDYSGTLRSNENYFVKFANNNMWLRELNANFIGSVSVQEATNSSDNGFYQVNTITDMSVDNTDLLNISRVTTVDGKVSSRFEWYDEEQVYNAGSDKLYLRTDDEYLYLYTESSDIVPDDVNINIYFATNAASSALNYNYAIQNNLIYPYDSTFGTVIGEVSNAKDIGFEYKMPLSTLKISSVDDLKSIKIEYLNQDGSNNKDYTVVVGEDEMVVDGLITYNGEYEDTNLFFSDSTRKIYTKISGGGEYLYIYAYDQNLVGQDISNTSLYIGSNDESKTYTTEGYMLWYESNLVLCDGSGCADKSPLQGYLHQRAVGDGAVEFMIPVSVIGITRVDDIRNLKILYKNSSWNEVKDNEIIYEYDSNSIRGKTAVVAKKPSDWNNMYIYVYGDKTPIEWPGVRMYPFNDGSDNNYVYVLPDNVLEAHVIFNNKHGIQTPAGGYDIFKIDKGQIKYWNGVIEDCNVNNWSNYDNSTSSDKNIYFKMKLPDGVSSDKGTCVHIYDDNGDKTGSWPGLALSYSNDSSYWEGSFAATGNYNNLRVIFNNCNNGYQIPDSTGVLIKPGITISYNDSKWIVLKDN